MKIAIINQHRQDFLGGSEIQCDIIASRLLEFGHEPVYFVVSPRKADYGVPYRTLPLPGLGFGVFLRQFRLARPDIVYWRHNKKGVIGALLAARCLRIPFIFSISHVRDVRTWTLYGESPFERYLAVWGKPAASLAKKLLSLVHPRRLPYLLDPIRSGLAKILLRSLASGAVSNNDFSEFIPVRRNRVIRNSIIPNSVPFQWSKPFVVWVANIKSRKNPDLFIRLAEAFKNENVDFLMIGAIQSEEYRHLEKSPSTDNFFYLGPKTPSEVNGILQEALFLVHTCNPEGFPNNLIQSWMQGKPTISLYFDPNGFIEAHHLGFYSRDFGTLIEETRTLLEDAGLREKLGANALAFATAHFDPEVNVRTLEAFLHETLSRDDRSSS